MDRPGGADAGQRAGAAYVGFYYWNNGSPELMLFMRNGGNWTQLGSTYNSGPLAAGTQLQVTAVGSTITLLLNGMARVISARQRASPAARRASWPTAAPKPAAGPAGIVGEWYTYRWAGRFRGCPGRWCCRITVVTTSASAANGSFTFATALAAGAAYDVTVKTSPSGQSCTVSGGSGTAASADVTNVAVSCTAGSTATGRASDNFSRADGPLGANWTDISDGAMAISSGAVIGTAGRVTGDVWNANTFTSDQFSQIQLTSTQLTGGQWVGPAVRMQNSGQDGYVGFYYWNNGSPELMLYKRASGSCDQLGSTYNSGPLAAGAQLELEAVGSTISLLLNGTQVISASDSSITGGAPGIMAYGSAQAGSWSGGDVASYTIGGGTVSGLSGTVVLQDNGGDDLSVSANGSFTFATALAAGAAYAVTVKTSPSGQSCTVSGGSGTVGLGERHQCRGHLRRRGRRRRRWRCRGDGDRVG